VARGHSRTSCRRLVHADADHYCLSSKPMCVSECRRMRMFTCGKPGTTQSTPHASRAASPCCEPATPAFCIPESDVMAPVLPLLSESLWLAVTPSPRSPALSAFPALAAKLPPLLPSLAARLSTSLTLLPPAKPFASAALEPLVPSAASPAPLRSARPSARASAAKPPEAACSRQQR
jgi:hypothetical protein